MAVKRNKSRKATPKVTPPGLTPLQKILLDEAGRKVTITSEGRQEEVSVEQVVTRRLLQSAASGSVHALSNAVNEIILAQRIMQQEIEADVEFAHRVTAHQQVMLDKARKEGKDLNTVLPHPDDIETIPGVGYKVHGPWDEAELKIVLGNCARRDLYILQAALEERLGDPKSDQQGSSSDEQFPGASAMVLVHFFNEGLPARFHKSDMHLITDLCKCRRLTKRDLLKIAHQEWAAIGSPKPRGWRMPSFSKTCADLERVTEGCIELLHEMTTGRIMSDRDISARLRQLQC